jgi:hypothetical protein
VKTTRSKSTVEFTKIPKASFEFKEQVETLLKERFNKQTGPTNLQPFTLTGEVTKKWPSVNQVWN